MIRIDLTPAQQGDCLWIEYGDARRPYRILIDGGTPATFTILKNRIESLPREDRRFEVVIITHIDSDHIGGILELLKNPPSGLEIGDVWFNGFRHLPSSNKTLGVRQAEEVSKELETGRFPWNDKFDEGPICVSSSGALPRIRLRDGMFLTLLSPYLEQLRELQPKWQREIEALRRKELEDTRHLKTKTLSLPLNVITLAESPFESDIAEANGSSLALMAEFEGKSLLLGADAFAPVLERSVRRLLSTKGLEKLRLDAFKISHHGSDANTSIDLLSIVDCRNYLISTNGSIYSHPDTRTVARILKHGGEVKTLHFNYCSPQTLVWKNRDLQHRHRYETSFPIDPAAGASFILS